MTTPTAPIARPDEAQALVEQARTEAQERVAELHGEEGTVRSEGARNSPSPEDVDPAAAGGQRVDEPTAVTGDAPAGGEPDARQLKEAMAEAARGDDHTLHDKERHAEDDVTAVKPDHRENDAGQ